MLLHSGPNQQWHVPYSCFPISHSGAAKSHAQTKITTSRHSPLLLRLLRADTYWVSWLQRASQFKQIGSLTKLRSLRCFLQNVMGPAASHDAQRTHNMCEGEQMRQHLKVHEAWYKCTLFTVRIMTPCVQSMYCIWKTMCESVKLHQSH